MAHSPREGIARIAYGEPTGRPSNGVGWAPIGRTLIRFLRNALEMVVLAPQGASDTYGQLSDIGADTIRAPRYGFPV